ncbi:MAG: glutathione S-transferase [Sandarakinorhabdus sp.]|nr:glutathione S-transferase [Sandarakinorhabdus sp.]
MLKLVITSRRYSSWSLRGWLAAKQSGLAFEEVMVDIYADDWALRKQQPDVAVANGKVPVLWDSGSRTTFDPAADAAIWNAVAIVDWLDRASGGTRFWPTNDNARAFGISIAVEMQAGFLALRQHCPMNMMRHYPGWTLNPEAAKDIARVDALWNEGLKRFGGPWLAGEKWGAADILYAPVASRFTTYDVDLSPAAEDYRQRAMAHPLVMQWIAAAAQETILQPAYEY